MATFVEAWALFADAALAGALAGGLLGALGIWVVARRLVFLSATLAQASGLGVALTFWAQSAAAGLATLTWLPAAGALSASLAAAGVVGGATSPKTASDGGRPREGALGWVYLFSAAGTLAVGTRIAEDLQDIQSLLFGSAVAVLPGDLRLLAGVVGLGGLAVALTWRGLAEALVDPVAARLRGLPVVALDRGLWGLLAAAVSVATHVLGALPVFAFSVLPAMAALPLARDLGRAQALAALFGAAAGAGGYALAYAADLPVGAAQTLFAAGEVALALGARPLVGLTRPRRRRAGRGCGP